MRPWQASHAIADALPVEIAQQKLGHASLATWTVYVPIRCRHRMKAMDARFEGQLLCIFTKIQELTPKNAQPDEGLNDVGNDAASGRGWNR